MKNEVMEVYEIWNGRRFCASFDKGDPSRFGPAFNREVAIQEFNSWISFQASKGYKGEWELRIRIVPVERKKQLRKEHEQ